MGRMTTNNLRTVWTIGHSTRSADDFVGLLHQYRIESVIDVRRFPGSRRNPQFHTDALAATLRAAGIGYVHLVALGGRRRPRTDSPNAVWRNAAFRGYADHMASPEFRDAFAILTTLATEQRCAILCAELLWWRCHRSMIADDLVLHGWRVIHILDNDKSAEHAFREPARLVDDMPVYDGGQTTLL